MTRLEDLDQLPFGAVLQYFRLAAVHTQQELADQVGYQLSLISMIERGQRFVKRRIVEDFATVLGLLPEERATLLAAYARTAAIRAASKVAREQEKRAASGIAATLGPLIAREQQLEHLTAALQMARNGIGRWVVLSGEPGIGKSRLALEVGAQAQSDDMLVAVGHCYPEQRSSAYTPFVELLEQVYAAIPPNLRATVSTRWPLVCRLLPDASPDTRYEEFAPSGSQMDQQMLWRQVADFLRAAADGQPLVMIIDDLHWADEASLDLLLFLRRRQHYLTEHQGRMRLFVVGTCRDTEIARHPTLREMLHALEKEHLADRVIPPPLTEPQTTDLLNAYLPSGAIASEVSDLIYRTAGGVPFATVELLQGLRTRGDLVLQGAVWQRQGDDAIELPTNIRDEIRDRVQQLSRTTQEALRDASVLGQVFLADTVQRMGTRSLDEVEEALDEAAEAGLVHDIGQEGYRFAHALVQDALLIEHRGMRRRLHRAAANALLGAPARRGQAAELAWHFREGDDLSQALIYSLQAGDDAEATYAHKDAQQQYKIAATLARDLGDQEREALALDRLADVHYLLGLFNEAYANLVRSTAIYRILENWERLAWATCQMAKVCDALGKIPESMRFVEALLDTLILVANRRNPSDAAPHPNTLEWRAEQAITVLTERTATRVLLCLEVRLTHLGRYDEVYPLSAATIAHARRAGDLRMESLAYSFRGIADAMWGQLDNAANAFQDALRTGEACGDLEAVYLALSNSGAIHQQRAAPRTAYQVLYQTLETIRRLGDTTRTSHVLRGLGDNDFILGNWSEARARYEESIAVGAHSDRLELHRSQLGLLHLDIVEGKRVLSENVSAIEAARTYQSEDIGIRLYVSSSLVEEEIIAGFAEAVRDRIQGSLARFNSDDPALCEQLALLAWAEWELGHEEAAHATLVEARQKADTIGSRLAYVTIWRVEAVIALAERRWDDALQALESLLALTREMPYPYAEAKALSVYGQLHRERGEPETARKRFAQALAIFNRLGERFYAERIERDLAALA
jgi:tetratricopeptide (TPR) repeat protein